MLGLFGQQVAFPKEMCYNQQYWWNRPIQKSKGKAGETGILGEEKNYKDDNQKIDYQKVNKAINI